MSADKQVEIEQLRNQVHLCSSFGDLDRTEELLTTASTCLAAGQRQPADHEPRNGKPQADRREGRHRARTNHYQEPRPGRHLCICVFNLRSDTKSGCAYQCKCPVSVVVHSFTLMHFNHRRLESTGSSAWSWRQRASSTDAPSRPMLSTRTRSRRCPPSSPNCTSR
jgi:hypothetical protein